MVSASEIREQISHYNPSGGPFHGELETRQGKFAITLHYLPDVDLSPDTSQTLSGALKQSLPNSTPHIVIGKETFISKMAQLADTPMGRRMIKAANRLSSAVIGDVGTVDNLIKAEEVEFPATTGAEVMFALGLIHPEKEAVVELGAAAGINPLGEVRVAARIVEDNKEVIYRRSADKVVTMPDDGNPTVDSPYDEHRGILSHASYTEEEADNGNQLVFGFIESGNGQTDILAAIRNAAEAVGIRNYAMAITVEGDDLIVNGAVLGHMPQKPIQTIKELVAVQKRKQLTGGSVDAVGTVFADRTDPEFKAMQARSDLPQTGYTSHFHSDRGGHIVSIVPGPNSKTYFVLSPVTCAVDIQPIQ